MFLYAMLAKADRNNVFLTIAFRDNLFTQDLNCFLNFLHNVHIMSLKGHYIYRLESKAMHNHLAELCPSQPLS